MRMLLSWMIISSILSTRLADSDQLNSNAEQVILFVRKVYQIFYNSFREKTSITILKVTTLVLIMSSSKGDRTLYYYIIVI